MNVQSMLGGLYGCAVQVYARESLWILTDITRNLGYVGSELYIEAEGQAYLMQPCK